MKEKLLNLLKKTLRGIRERGRSLKNRIKNHEKKPMKSGWKKFWFVLGTVIMIFCVTGAICATAFAMYVQTGIDADFDVSFQNIKLNYTTTIMYTDEKGQDHEYAKLYGTENRVWVDYEDFPEALKIAIVSIEDERFWSHHGVDWKRTFGAFLHLVTTLNSGYGGSTITQQLIKNITSYDDVSIKRKVTEILRALRVEQELSKEQILEYYLNTINLGHGCYGVGSAAKTYFGKEVKDLTVAECASIAGITNLPYYYDPINYPEHNIKRQQTILWKMKELGKIDAETYEAAWNEELKFGSGEEENTEKSYGINSYFTDMLISDLLGDLQTKKGYSKQVATQLLYNGGLTVYATVEPRVQNALETVFESNDNFQTVNTSIQPECAMIVYNPEGSIVGVVGGRGVKLQNRVLNRATQSKRQPGSSIKPIAVYAPAIEMGLITPYSVFDDTPMYYTVNGSFVDETYVPKDIEIKDETTGEVTSTVKEVKKVWPKNYYDPYRGLITVKEAVEDSTNTVAVRVLEKLTVDKSFDFVTDTMGLSSLVDGDVRNGTAFTDKGLPQLALGGMTDGVILKELVAAYVTFVNHGVYTSPRSYTKVINSDGEVLLNNVPELTVALSERTVYYMNTLLSSVVENGTGTAAKIGNGIATAGKTGSTNDDKDRWFIGYTPYYVAGCWYGYDAPQVISGVSGNPALKAWKAVMSEIHKGLGKKSFETTVETVSCEYCTCSGGIPTDACKADLRGSRVAKGTFVKGDEPVTPCANHVFASYDTVSGTLARATCPAAQTKQVGMLDINRYYTVSGVTVKDEQYTLRTEGISGLPYTDTEGLQYFHAVPVLSSGRTAVNTFCKNH